ncbi:sulfatase-like hydrolase/transferase [Pontiellaceae bacterium B12219]|nr:sulfatase-like hydrolase/transferase [Pontiellaceae bacterium B12219]
MVIRWVCLFIAVCSGMQGVWAAGNEDPAKPNVVMIYYDDMGYGDMGINDPSQPSFTPNLDTFAGEGVRFTAGHSADAICTPSRYALMTGRYCWRTSLKGGVNQGYSPSLMESDRFTFANMFRSMGYSTSMIGKWHIGMQFCDPNGDPVVLSDWNDTDVLGTNTNSTADDKIDFSKTLSNTPYHCGFDYYFGTAASLDMPPYVWIENDTVLYKGGIVTNGAVDFSQAVPATNADLEEGTPFGDFDKKRDGVYDPTFVLADYLQIQAQKVSDILAERAADETPFFLYIPMPAPHTPWAVQDAFNTNTNFPYGDYLTQTDFYTGQILDALDEYELDSNTVVFISSDNGPEFYAFENSITNGHDANGPFAGVKRDNWEGGTRVPFMIRWPGVVEAGTTNDHACWQGDFFASMAAHIGYDLAEGEAPDAESFLPVLQGNPMPDARRAGFCQHSSGGQIAIVDKDGIWKLLDGTGSGGYGVISWDADNNPISDPRGTIFGNPKQLFNLALDPGERTNLLAVASPSQESIDKANELYALLNEIRGDTSYGTDGDSNVPPADNDADQMSNAFENTYEGLDRNDPTDGGYDFEPDGLNNVEEYLNGANPWKSDSDDDRLSDYEEVHTYGTQAGSAHSDGDDLEDGDEVLIWNTDPLKADSDGDGVDDDAELSALSNPLDPTSKAYAGTPGGTLELGPVDVLSVGYNGTTTTLDTTGSWGSAGTIFVREHTSLAHKTRVFLRFDFSGIEAEITGARLRIHQKHRLNTQAGKDLSLAVVADSWDVVSGSYPTYSGIGVTDSFVFGNHGQFGKTATSGGFFSGTAGIPASDDSGFDVTSIVQGWQNGTRYNYGFRISFSAEAGYVAASFSDADDPSTENQNEALQLILTTAAIPEVIYDSDGDRLLDSYEMDVYGNLDMSGDDVVNANGDSALLIQAMGSNAVVEVISTNAPAVNVAFHRNNKVGLGYEVLVSENLSTWDPYTKYYRVASPAPASELGEEFDKVFLEPHSALPSNLFYRVNVHTY